MRRIYVIMLLTVVGHVIYAQNNTMPEVGNPMPNFTLNNIAHYKATKASLADFKGKWLFLDFWFIGCTSCIASFPKINGFQEKFKDKIQFIMIAAVDDKEGSWKKTKSTMAVFETLKKNKNLSIPCVYDSILYKNWEVYAMPRIIIINPDGIVKAITSGVDMTDDKIQELIEGKTPKLKQSGFERSEFLAGIDNINPKPNDSLILSQSILMKWMNETQMAEPVDYQLNNADMTRKGYKASMVSKRDLYKIAYLGKMIWGQNDPLYGIFYPEPLLEIHDKDSFVCDYNTGKGFYNYSLDVPPSKARRKDLMQIMQADLKSKFGYEVSIETRKMPVWKLISKPGGAEKLKSKSKFFTIRSPDSSGRFISGIISTRLKMETFLQTIIQYLKLDLPLYDETGITDRIDISMETDMTNLGSVVKELQKNGLDLVKGTREFQVLVIRDEKPNRDLDVLINPILALTPKDTIKINEAIKKIVLNDSSSNPHWETLNLLLNKQYPLIAKQILFNTKAEYYLHKKDIVNFEKVMLVYPHLLISQISEKRLAQYANFIADYSLNKDLLMDADNWRFVYLSGRDLDPYYYFASGKIIYKLYTLLNNDYAKKGGLNLVNIAFKSEPNNIIFKETLEKMEKGEVIW
jgi:thiol-disulfide isomerase/thioredoxin